MVNFIHETETLVCSQSHLAVMLSPDNLWSGACWGLTAVVFAFVCVFYPRVLVYLFTIFF